MKIEFLRSVIVPFRRVTSPGASPGTVVDVPEEPDPVIRVIAYGPDEFFEEPVDSIDQLPTLRDRYRVSWINVDGLGDSDVIRRLGEIFDLHDLALEDVVNVDQRVKVEDYDDHVFVVSRMVDAERQLRTEQIALFVGENYVLSFQSGLPGDCLDPVRQRIRRGSGRIRSCGTDYLLYALLDSVIDHYFPVLESYGDRLDGLDESLINGHDDRAIAELHQLRSELVLLRRTLRPHQDLLTDLRREGHALIGDETRVFLRDCYDHTIQLVDAIDSYRETCAHVQDFHLAALGNRTNEAMKTLTIIATLFIPMSFVAGLYGMNFRYMPELHWRYGYPLALGVMAAISLGQLWWIRRRGWFSR